MMDILFSLLCLVAISTLFAIWVLPYIHFDKAKIFEKIQRYSYWGLLKEFGTYGYSYPIVKYAQQALIVGFISFTLVYSTLQDLFYSSILTVMMLLILPYFILMNCVRIYQNHLQQEIFSYVEYGILFLKENRNVTGLLSDCTKIVDLPLRDDLNKMINEIMETADIRLALSHFEAIYPQEEIKKLDNLLISKNCDGISNLKQYELTYSSIEANHMIINNYQLGRETKRKGFYMIILLSLLSSYMVKSLFNVDMGMDPNKINFYYFLFFLFHLIIVIFYEHWSVYKNRFN